MWLYVIYVHVEILYYRKCIDEDEDEICREFADVIGEQTIFVTQLFNLIAFHGSC